MVITDTAIPFAEFPDGSLITNYAPDKLVSIKQYFKREIIVEPVYYNNNLAGSIDDCLIREKVAKLLALALKSLPQGLTFKVYDAYRTVKTQQALYDKYYAQVKLQYPNFSLEQLEQKTKEFVSKPSLDSQYPSVHNTGGAIDLTLFDIVNNRELNMGTVFDDFTSIANTNYFEHTETNLSLNEEIKNNRRLLYWTMIAQGFTNLPTEWWHYDYGDRFWFYYTGNPAIFDGVI